MITSYVKIYHSLRKSSKHKCYPYLKCCVSFPTEHALKNIWIYVIHRNMWEDELSIKMNI